MSPQPIIEIKNVTKEFDDLVVVNSANFDIKEGEFFSLLGPSGCGKTTTLRMIAGFDRPSEGQIKLAGEDVSNTPPYKRDVNTVFQQYALFPHMSLLKNVMFGLTMKGVKKSEARTRSMEMLEIVQLADYADRKPQQLSGGQQQRVALARALVNKPKALLLDEPLSALDLKLRQAMQLELKRIQREVGITFIFVTHDQTEALTMSDRIAVMSKGNVEQIGTPEEIYNVPATKFVAGFIGDANLIQAEVQSVDEEGLDLRVGADVIRSESLAGTFEPGDRVVAMIRPERIILKPENDPAKPTENYITCEVLSHSFQGAESRYSLMTKSGQEMFAYIDWTDELPNQETGATVRLTCDRKVVRTFSTKGEK